MFTTCKNSKKQGDVGLGVAIGWFTTNHYTVAIPLTDSQDYDLIVDKDNALKRVQVKTTSRLQNGMYQVELRTLGGNQSWQGVAKHFDNTNVELVFVLTAAGDKYLIPAAEVKCRSIMSLGKKYDKYKLGADPHACL